MPRLTAVAELADEMADCIHDNNLTREETHQYILGILRGLREALPPRVRAAWRLLEEA